MSYDAGLTEAVLERLRGQATLADLGLHQIDGRWDLRALTLDPPDVIDRSTTRLIGGGEHEIARLSGVTRLENVELANLDFTGAHLPSLRLTGCRIRNCLFDGAMLDSMKSFGSSFENSSFEKASLRDAVLGGKHRGRASTFDRVRFIGAVMERMIPDPATFTDCDFSMARLKGTEFWDSRLTRCRFAGKLEKVIFAARRPVLGLFGHEETLIDVDFSEAIFLWVEFRGMNLDRVTLPTSPGHIVVRQPECVVDRLLRELGPQPDPDLLSLLAVLEAERDWRGPRQSQAVFVVRELGKTDKSRARAVELIRWAAERCAGAAGPEIHD